MNIMSLDERARLYNALSSKLMNNPKIRWAGPNEITVPPSFEIYTTNLGKYKVKVRQAPPSAGFEDQSADTYCEITRRGSEVFSQHGEHVHPLFRHAQKTALLQVTRDEDELARFVFAE